MSIVIEEVAEPTVTEDVEIEPAGSAESTEPAPPAEEDLVMDDLLVEEVSIDGMCGVY
jgi:mycofactocin precursor